ncbi:MAG: zinc-dependent metalloprotease [Planctomycetota bacterium]
MTRPTLTAVALLLLLPGCASQSPTESAERSEDVPVMRAVMFEAAADLEHLGGLVDLYLDHENGKVWMGLPAPDPETGVVGEYLYVRALRAGLGSNPVGLDRGQLGGTSVVTIRELGGRLVIEEQNLSFRAESENLAEREAVREAFATSIVWAGEIEERSADRILVDATSFVVRDATGIANRLRGAGQGSFSLDRRRSLADTRAALSFPENTVMEAVLTFSGSQPGREVRATTPDPTSVTLAIRHTLVRLPDDGYTPRAWDPRMASFSERYADYAAPLDGPITKRWIARHRLEKTDPEAEVSTAVEPIVYYVDRGAPEPVRTALIEGARWWGDAFRAAGFVDAYRVEELPEGIHPLDVRYNVIQWVHRATRGWSYGASVADPRTGEIIKGHVSLGSLRVRQDRRIFEGLAGTAKTGTGDPDDPVEISLARLRQLSAHEVGHTLGFAHNFAASARDRASVMDYPAPLVRARADGSLDFSEAYDTGIGEWDVFCVRFAYAQFPADADETAELDAIIREAYGSGQLYMSDADARPAGSAHPHAALWDNGADPVAALREAMRVRSVALAGFGRDRIPERAPLAELNDTFVPVYLHHRYQVEAAAKVIAGVEYTHGIRAVDEPLSPTPVDADRQRAALGALLETIEPAALDTPDAAIAALNPDTVGASRAREVLRGNTRPLHDPLRAASVVSDLVISLILDPVRLSRLHEQRRIDGRQLGLEETLDRLTTAVIEGPPGEPARLAQIRHVTQAVLLERLIETAQDASVSLSVRAAADTQIERFRQSGIGQDTTPHAQGLAKLAARHQMRPFDDPPPTRSAAPAPPGSPIGSGRRTGSLGIYDFLGSCSMPPF